MIADWTSALLMVASSALVALAGLALLQAVQTLHARKTHQTGGIFTRDPQGTTFLFDGKALLDATPKARALLSGEAGRNPWNGLMGRLGPMFPGLAAMLEALPDLGEVTLSSGQDIEPPMQLRAEYRSGTTRLSLIEDDGSSLRDGGGAAVLVALQQEVQLQRNVLLHNPTLIWREDGDGDVTWANHAYLIRASELLPEGRELSWPLPRLFPRPETGVPAPTRVRLQMRGGAEWFDLARQPQGAATLCYGVPANAAVQAETTLREFMQTLTKTFADLPIGLAIFDRARTLQLFNPALADLLALAPEFLISRPSLNAVLDALRTKAMLPEPKDYRSWRRQLTRVEEEASQGVFEETWSLPGGQTYRVIGRPHPNGALAFMFEDISSEMIRTRAYRADLELGQSVIDAVDEGVAVFSQAGQLVMSNLVYAEIWQHDPAVLLSDAGIATLCAWWKEHSAPSLIWDDAQDFVRAVYDRSAWEGEVRLLDGRLLACSFRPLTGGATLISFRVREGERNLARPEILVQQRLSA